MKAVNYRAIRGTGLRMQSFRLLKFEAYPPAAVGVVVGDDSEPAYLRGVCHMGTDAGAGVVVSDAHNAQGVRDILRQFAQIHYRACLG